MARPKGPPPLSAGQVEIMNVVWDRDEVTVGEVWQVLSARRGITRNTVQTTMTRLEEKGWLKHRTVGQTFLYLAVHPRTSALGQMVEHLVESAFEGSAEGLVMALLQGRGVSDEEARRIEKMIRDARPARRGRRK